MPCRLGCALQKKTIDRDIVLDVIADLDLEPLREQKPAAKTPADSLAATESVFIAETKKRSIFSRWIPSVAIICALLIGLSWFAVRRGAQAPENSSTIGEQRLLCRRLAPLQFERLVTTQAPSSAQSNRS